MSEPSSSSDTTPKTTPYLVTISSPSPKSRIILRSPRKSDSPALTARAHDPECTKYLPHIANPKNPITVASNERMIRIWRDDSGLGGMFLIIELKPDLVPSPTPTDVDVSDPVYASIGETGFGPLSVASRTGECGVMLASWPWIRRKGYAVEALDMCFAYGFEHLDLESIELGTDKDNMPMKKLLEGKLGLDVVWREEKADWCAHASKGWWDERVKKNGKVELTVKTYPVEEED